MEQARRYSIFKFNKQNDSMHSLELEQNFLKIDILASSIKSPINELRIHQYILIGGGQKISRDESLDLLRKSYQIKDVCYT